MYSQIIKAKVYVNNIDALRPVIYYYIYVEDIMLLWNFNNIFSLRMD
jgi:hypothetical protein